MFLRLRILLRVWLSLKKWQRFNVHYVVVFFTSATKHLSRKLSRGYLWRPKYQRRRGHKFARIPRHPSPCLFFENVQWMTHAHRRGGKNRVMAKSWSKHQGKEETFFFAITRFGKIFEFGASLTKKFCEEGKKIGNRSCVPERQSRDKISKTPTFRNWNWVVEGHLKRSRSYWRAVELSFFPFCKQRTLMHFMIAAMGLKKSTPVDYGRYHARWWLGRT